MPTTNYSSSSVYRNTPMNKRYLETYEPPLSVDFARTRTFKITSKYKHRPDLLSYDMFGDSNLWWVFSLYNRDILVDPIYDMVPGIEIVMPASSSDIGV